MQILKRIYYRLIKWNFVFLYKGIKKYDLIIYDDFYPHPISGFRKEEITNLLSEINPSKIILNPKSYSRFNAKKDEHKDHIKNIIKENVVLNGKLKRKIGFVNINTKLFYCIFLNNIFQNLKWLEQYKIPFIFTLYPGGGFQINNADSYAKLRSVFNSKMFRKVIVNQSFTRDYLRDNNLCELEQIVYIYGGVVPQLSIKKETKSTTKDRVINICFCAAKNMPRGEDKGYDVFIEVMRKIVKKFNWIQGHVIGGFNKNDIYIEDFKDNIHFYGYQEFENLGLLFEKMDIIVSPNKPFMLSKGSYDGFPLGTVVEAVLNGCVAVVTDSLTQNEVFVDNEDLIIVEHNVASIEKEIISLINDREKLNFISYKGREKFRKIFSNKNQVQPRINLLNKYIFNSN